MSGAVVDAADAREVSERASAEIEAAVHRDGGKLAAALEEIGAAAARGERGVVLYYDTRPETSAVAHALEARRFHVVDVATRYMFSTPAIRYGKGGVSLGASQFAIGVTW